MMATKQATFDTIEVQDGIELEVAEDPEDSITYAVGGTVSVDETVSTGDYESYEPYASMRVQFRPVIRLVSDKHRRAARQRLLSVHRDVHHEIQQMINNRISEPGFENWEATAKRMGDDDDG